MTTATMAPIMIREEMLAEVVCKGERERGEKVAEVERVKGRGMKRERSKRDREREREKEGERKREREKERKS